MKVPLLTAAGGAAWEADLVVALEHGGHGVAVVRRCVDVVELLAVAATGQGRAALVASDLPRLDRAALDRLTASGVVAVGVVDRHDAGAAERMHALGITATVPSDADPAVVAAVVNQALEATSGAGPDGGARAFADPAGATAAVVPPTLTPQPVPSLVARGAVIAVWGATGAPGRTTVAVTLADELARLGGRTLLVDADVYGGVVAAHLGLLDDSPGLAAACRHAAGGRLDPSVLAGLAWQLGERLRVLTGLPRADRWPELRPAGVTAVLDAGRGLAEFTVVDLGFSVEQDEELSYDTAAPRRNGATLAALDAADLVLVVGAADPIGVQRLVRGLAELREADVQTPVWIALNRVRAGAVPGDPEAELAAAVRRFTGQDPVAYLPADVASLDAAVAVGRTLAEIRPQSPLRTAVADLAATLAGVPATRTGRRGRRASARPARGRRRAG